jgi:hypothetical protein
MNRLCWSIICWAACAAPLPIPPPSTSQQLPPCADNSDHGKAEAARILRAYADSHAFGDIRRAPTPAEEAAAVISDPIDPETGPAHWRTLDTGFRLQEVYAQAQRRGWLVACNATVGRWWQSARRIDDEMAARLALRPPPADFYAGMAYWSSHWQWFEPRRQLDAAFNGVVGFGALGAEFRLVAAQNEWSATWPAQGRPLERVLSERRVPGNADELGDLASRQAFACTATRRDASYDLTPLRVGLIRPAGPPFARPTMESGHVAQIRKHDTEWLVTRRDWTTITESIPPCRRFRCREIDCAMDERHGWREQCAQKVIRRHEDHRFVLHFDAAPVKVRIGDAVGFYLDPETGHAVLAYASRRDDLAPYFFLDP